VICDARATSGRSENGVFEREFIACSKARDEPTNVPLQQARARRRI